MTAMQTNDTYTDLLSEFSKSAADVFRHEAGLIRAEMHETVRESKRHALIVGMSVGLVAMSAGALVVFLILSVGHLMNDRYDLSAIIVSGVFAVLGLPLSAHMWFKLESDFDFPKSRRSLKRLLGILEGERTI